MLDKVIVNKYELKRYTTIQQLEPYCNSDYAAIITYGKYVFFTDMNLRKKYIAAVYEFFTDWREDYSPIKITATADKIFKDNGHAIEWCFKQVKTPANKSR
ncbi:MAG: hypothetical protein LUG52_01195 [Clostridia bacterium]|nr:hypothetical protein [Clostridia bacterium]